MTPLEIVSAAVAGDDLASIAGAAASALDRPIAVVLPSLGEPLVAPAGQAEHSATASLVAHAKALVAGETPANGHAEAVPVLVGAEVLGIVAALGPRRADAELGEWLRAVAAAVAVALLLRETGDGDASAARRAFLQSLAVGALSDATALVTQAQRLGCDLASGAIALCARRASGGALVALPAHPSALLAEVASGYVLGLVPLGSTPVGLEALRSDLSAQDMAVATAIPRRDPSALHEAIREAELMLALTLQSDSALSTEEETYRLLIGVLLRDRGELEQLHRDTVAALQRYDAEHDTDLLATLRAFLAHHGSTTETAEAMQLHRHTVGYRLSRVQEVSGLSPYETGGRERLGLGLKADRILTADSLRPSQAAA